MNKALTRLVLAALLAGFALGGAAQAQTTLAPVSEQCFHDAAGKAHASGDSVLDSQGADIGWVSIAQCGEGAKDSRLYVRLDGSSSSLVTFSPANVVITDGQVSVKVTEADLIARLTAAFGKLSQSDTAISFEALPVR